jgi:hypothetical protein
MSSLPAPGLSELMDWPTEHLIEAARRWTATADRWTGVFTQVWQDSLSVDWDGAAAAALQTRTTGDKPKVEALSDHLYAAVKVARSGASDLQTASSRLVYAVEDAHAAGFDVGKDCSITDRQHSATAAQRAERHAQAQTFAADIGRRATHLVALDQQVAGRITGALSGVGGVQFADAPAGNGAVPLDNRFRTGPEFGDEDPKQFHDFWAGLTPAQKDRLYSRDHNIGNHPGMPFTDKDHYNRLHLDELTKTAQADVARIQHSLEVTTAAPNVDDGALYALQTQLAAAKSQLAGYKALQIALHPPADPEHPDPLAKVPRLLGHLDGTGHAAVSVGDPDHAKRNAVFVPGTGQDLAAFEGSNNKSIRMRRGALDADPSLAAGDVAVTTWMGYDRPMGASHAAFPDLARAGAGNLDAFESGMRASHVGAPSVDTVIGHSYGSTVLGAAASGGHHLDADNVIAVGSPGVLVSHAGDLNLDPGAQVYAMRANHDVIGLAAGWTLGADPTAPMFGATRLETDPGPAGSAGLPSIAAHSSYWELGNKELDNFGAVIAGTPPPHVVGHR